MRSISKALLAFSLVLLLPSEVSAQSPPAQVAGQPAPRVRPAVKSSQAVASARTLIIALQGYGEELEPPSAEVFKKLQGRISPVVAQLHSEGRRVDAQRLALWNQSVAKKLYSEDSEAYKTATSDLELANGKVDTAITPSSAVGSAGKPADSAVATNANQAGTVAVQKAKAARESMDNMEKLRKMFPGKYR